MQDDEVEEWLFFGWIALVILMFSGCGDSTMEYTYDTEKEAIAAQYLQGQGFEPPPIYIDESCLEYGYNAVENAYQQCLQYNSAQTYFSAQTHCQLNKSSNKAKVEYSYYSILGVEKANLKLCLIEGLWSLENPTRVTIDSVVLACYNQFEWALQFRKSECQNVFLQVF